MIIGNMSTMCSGQKAADRKKRLTKTQRQAGAFAWQYADLLSKEQRDLLLAWADCETESSYIKKLKQVLKYRLRKNDLIRTAGLLWAL